MPCFASQQIKGVGQQRKHGAQGAGRPGGAARQVEDERAAADAADAAAQGGEGRLACSLLTNEFSQTGHQALTDGQGRLWRIVTCGKAGSARGEYEGDEGGGLAEARREGEEVIGQHTNGWRLSPRDAQQFDERRSGTIDLGAGKTAIADREHSHTAAEEGGYRHAVSIADEQLILTAIRNERMAATGVGRGVRNLLPPETVRR